MFTQYRGHQSRDERSWFTCFTIVMMGWGHHHPPDHSLHFHFLCNVETLHVCIYKLCCSCMFFMISSALGGEDCKAQQHPLWIPFISGSRFQVCCLDRPKINYGQNGVSCFSFSFFFFLNAKIELMFSFSDAQTLIHAFVLGHLRSLDIVIYLLFVALPQRSAIHLQLIPWLGLLQEVKKIWVHFSCNITEHNPPPSGYHTINGPGIPLLTASTFSPLTPGQRGVTDILATFY